MSASWLSSKSNFFLFIPPAIAEVTLKHSKLVFHFFLAVCFSLLIYSTHQMLYADFLSLWLLGNPFDPFGVAILAAAISIPLSYLVIVGLENRTLLGAAISSTGSNWRLVLPLFFFSPVFNFLGLPFPVFLSLISFWKNGFDGGLETNTVLAMFFLSYLFGSLALTGNSNKRIIALRVLAGWLIMYFLITLLFGVGYI